MLINEKGNRRKAISHAVFHRSLCLCQCKLYATQVELLKSCNDEVGGINTVNWQAFSLLQNPEHVYTYTWTYMQMGHISSGLNVIFLCLVDGARLSVCGLATNRGSCLLYPVSCIQDPSHSLPGLSCRAWVMANKLDMLTVCHCVGSRDRRPRNFMLKLIASISHGVAAPTKQTDRQDTWQRVVWVII